MARIAALRTVDVIRAVDDSVVPYFEEAAKALLEGDKEAGVSAIEPVTALAKALAKICGHTELKRRSLMNGSEDYVTMQIVMPPNGKVIIRSPGSGGSVAVVEDVAEEAH